MAIDRVVAEAGDQSFSRRCSRPALMAARDDRRASEGLLADPHVRAERSAVLRCCHALRGLRLSSFRIIVYSGACVGSACRDRPNGRQQILVVTVLQQVTTGAGPEHLSHVDAIRIYGQGNDSDRRLRLVDPLGCFYPVKSWHANINEDNIR